MNDPLRVTGLSKQNSKRLFAAYSIYIAVSVIAHFVIISAGKYYANDRMMGIFKNPNQMGFFLVAYYLIYILKIRKSTGSKWDYFLPVVLLGILVMTGSRSALAAMAVVHLMHFILIKKWSYLLSMLLLSIPIIAVITYNTDKERIIQIISRRDVGALDDVGNMRFRILVETFNESTTKELIAGKGASIGTNGMIYEQKKTNQDIIWLDNLVNVLFYNWGLLGVVFLLCVLTVDILKNIPVMKSDILVTLFFLVASFFFVLSDFFPLALLLVYLKTPSPDESSQEIFGNHSLLQ